MGANFNLTKWSNSWLTASGVNVLDPQIDFENNYIRTLKIRQTSNDNGKNQLRRQKIDIAIFSDTFEGYSLNGIILSDANE